MATRARSASPPAAARRCADAPHHHLFARADWSFAGDTRAAIADYSTLDLSLRTLPGKSQWDFAVSVRNLFNADVREPSLAPGTARPNDLPQARRSLYLEASYRL